MFTFRAQKCHYIPKMKTEAVPTLYMRGVTQFTTAVLAVVICIPLYSFHTADITWVINGSTWARPRSEQVPKKKNLGRMTQQSNPDIKQV